jgi:phosphate-selective porin OprO/OprP
MNALFVKKYIFIFGLCLVSAKLIHAQPQDESAGGSFSFSMGSQAQFDMAHYFNLKNVTNVDGDPIMVGGISLRRLRLSANAKLDSIWDSRFTVDFANGIFGVRDAFVQYNGLKNFQFRLGNFNEDFSMEQTTSSRHLSFLERPMVVNCFAPGRYTGIWAQWQKYDFLRTSIGVTWQATNDINLRNNVEELIKAGRPIGPNFTGKIVLMPWASDEFRGLHIGYNTSYRSAKKIDGSGRGYRSNLFSSRNATDVNRITFLSTEEFHPVKHDLLNGFEFAGYKNGFRVAGEFIINSTVMEQPQNIAVYFAPKLFFGYYFQASYLLFGGKQRYNSTESVFVRPTRGKSWGDIEVMARFDYLNLNNRGIYGGSGYNIALGVVYHINNNVMMMLNYQISQNDEHANNTGFNVVQARIQTSF